MECPACSVRNRPIFKCDNCGDIRHGGASGCPGNKKGPHPEIIPSLSRQCPVCKKGSYKPYKK